MAEGPSENSESTTINHQSRRQPQTAADMEDPPSRRREWKLEDSSMWWLSYAEWRHPGTVLMLASVPFCAGAYLGSKIPTSKLEELAAGPPPRGLTAGSGGGIKRGVPEGIDPRVVATRTAIRAFRVATLGTVGTFGLAGAAWFYASGYQSFGEAISGTKSTASQWRQSLEHFFGGDVAISKTHPDVLATKDMKGDEELQYLYQKYIKDSVTAEVQIDQNQTNERTNTSKKTIRDQDDGNATKQQS